jgi:hypothetical protein
MTSPTVARMTGPNSPRCVSSAVRTFGPCIDKAHGQVPCSAPTSSVRGQVVRERDAQPFIVKAVNVNGGSEEVCRDAWGATTVLTD